MAIIYAGAQGNIIRVLKNEEEEQQFPGVPSGTAFTIIFDETTNVSLINLLGSDWNSFSCPNGVLQRNQTPYNIVAPGISFNDSSAIGNLNTLLGVASGNLTQTQIKTLFRIIFRKLKKIN